MIEVKQQGENMVDRKQAAYFLGVSPHTLRTWAQKNKGPKLYKLEGWAVRYCVRDLMDFRDRSLVEPASK